MKNGTNRLLRAFLCHASGDKLEVQKLYLRLISDGVDAWLDKEKLLPGQNWKIEIQNAVRNSDVVIVCLSSQSVNKEGFVQKEIKIALDAADEKPEGTIFIIPARLENCNLPERISEFHWVDLFSDDGYKRLLKSLQLRASTVGAIIKPAKKERGSVKPESKKEDLSAEIPTFNLYIGKWYFTVVGEEWKGANKFYIIFSQDGTLVYKSTSSNVGTSGVWSQNGSSIHFEVGSYSKWDGTIDDKKMTGKVSNKERQFAEWSAIFQP
ncbi:MAG: toll/interleukin-1 receptor domain-containing protein [Methylococcales bacterium]|nr:toll/interleukin-1 receptor domain-containing protein [Methylococcales bacterium]